MNNFIMDVREWKNSDVIFISGESVFPNYPINLSTLSKEYIENKLNEAFASLKLEKPIKIDKFKSKIDDVHLTFTVLYDNK